MNVAADKSIVEHHDQLGVFAKYWRPGQVKTRLAISIGGDSTSQQVAAKLHRLLLFDLLDRLGELDAELVLGFSPREDQQGFAAAVNTPWRLWCQPSGDLGERMKAYFEDAFGRGAKRVLLIGSDCPFVHPQLIETAFQSLAENDVVLGPSIDGGYYLVGLAAPHAELFTDVPWSTPDVWSATMRNLERTSMRLRQLPVQYDIDRRADLERLMADNSCQYLHRLRGQMATLMK